MTEIFGFPVAVILGQLTLGLVNGSFYAMLSLGLAVIFGLMGVVNFAHGAFYTLGAFAALLGLQWFGVNYWAALVLAPLAVGLLGIVVERLFLRRLYGLDPLYGLLLTFGLALIAEGALHQVFGSTGQSYPVPPALAGAINLGFGSGSRQLLIISDWAQPYGPPPRTHRFSRPSASMCRCWSPRPTAAAWRWPRSRVCWRRRSCW